MRLVELGRHTVVDPKNGEADSFGVQSLDEFDSPFDETRSTVQSVILKTKVSSPPDHLRVRKRT